MRSDKRSPINREGFTREGFTRFRIRRPLVVFVTAFLLFSASTQGGVAFADDGAVVTAKSINTTTGPCADNSSDSCGAAVYTGSGFSGTVSYQNPGSTSQLADFICVHTPSSAAFVSLGGAYTLTARSSSGSVLATSSYDVAGNVDCTGAANPTTGSIQSFTVPADGSVTYSVLISGLTASICSASLSAYNSIRNQVFDLTSGSHVASPSVAPCGTPPLVPEAPFSSLLLVSGSLGSLAFLMRKNGVDFVARARGFGQAFRGL